VHGTIESIFRVEWRPLAELGSIAAQWRALAVSALEPNVFYEPAFALAAAPVFGQGVGAGLVWSRSTPARLLGLFPARIEHRRYGLPLPVLVGWMHPYAPFGAPLVDRDQGEAVLAAWLEHVAKDAQLPDLMLLPYLPMEGALAKALDAAMARRGGRSALFAQHRRALLAPAGERAGYLDQSLGHKKRKELRRQRKRLGDSGSIMSTVTGDPAAVSHALNGFFALEAAGWKGRAGTAARSHAEITQFMTTAVSALAGEGKAQVGRFSLDANPIAALVTLRSAAAAWCWKIAYDENYARFSPGVQILLDVTQALLDDASLARADSCATADHPMIDHVWRERLALADRLLCVDPGRSIGFTVARRLEALQRMAIDGAKALRDIIKRR
jgi:CelD/BcsL family acetyltransferase involved in cellulose biosynthesis